MDKVSWFLLVVLLVICAELTLRTTGYNQEATLLLIALRVALGQRS